MKGAVTLLCHDRPNALAETVMALQRCDGVAGWPVIVVAEEPTREVLEEIGCAWPISLPTVFVRRGRGPASREARVSRATFDALALGFARADLVLHLEDDVVLARDALRFVEWAGDRYRDDPDVFSISTFNPRPGPRSPRDAYSARKEPGWMSTGWATWRDRWEEMRAGWGWGDTPWWDPRGYLRDGRPWDHVVAETIRRGRCHVYPVISRSQHVGHAGGSPHTPRVEASAFAGDLVLPPWHELEDAA